MSVPHRLDPPPGSVTRAISTGHVVTSLAVTPSKGSALLVPGFTGSKEDFFPVLEPLQARGWTVHALDQRGQYDSPGQPGRGYTLAELADDLRDVLADLDDGYPVHLVGHSLGGLVAAEAVRRGARPDSLTLLCSGPGALPQERHGALPALVAVLPAMALADVWAAKEALDRDAGVETPPAEVHAFLNRRFLAADPLALKGMAEILLSQSDGVDELASTGVTVHVAYGAGDDAWPLADQDDMAHRLHTVARVIPGSAHSPAVEAPEPTADLLDGLWSGRV